MSEFIFEFFNDGSELRNAVSLSIDGFVRLGFILLRNNSVNNSIDGRIICSFIAIQQSKK